jgi:signal transduction histidine kinase
MNHEPDDQPTILLVDDEDGIRKVLGISLADMGYRVVEAWDSKVALKVFRQETPAIVMSDIKMPGKDGIELLQEIKRLQPETEVIMITGHGDMELAIKSLQYEAADFVTKPINDTALEIALRRARERIAMRCRLKQYTEKLEQMVAEKTRKLLDVERMAAVGETVAGLSHSIKNITGGLNGGAFVVEKGLELEDPHYLRQGWQMVRSNVEKIAKLSLDLLNYSKTTQIHIQQSCPNDPVKEVIELMRPRAEEEGITLFIDLDQNLKPIYYDPDAIHRALLNLVTNAFDACSDIAGAHGDLKVSIKTCETSGWGVTYHICDTGCGMDAHTRSKIFETFFTTKGQHGTGIGLMMTKHIIEKHHGTIEVRSKLRMGTEFIVRLPDGRSLGQEESLNTEGEADELNSPASRR